MPNVKYLAHLSHQTQKTPNIIYAKSHHFYNMWTVSLQICNGMIWCGISFNHFLFFFSLLSLHFSFSDITPLHSFLLSLFFLHNLVVFLSDITLSFFFSPFSFFTLISVAVVLFFYFCSDLIPGSAMGGLRWWLADHWWWVVMVRFNGGWVGWWWANRWWWVLLCEIGGAKSVNGFRIGESVVRNRWIGGAKSVNGFRIGEIGGANQ